MTPRGLIKLTAVANRIEAWRDWNALAAEYPKIAARFQPKENASWSQIDKASRKLREAIRDQQFSDGVAAGEADMRIVSQPVGTNGHTEGEYLRIKETYEAAAFAIEPTDYQRGYAIGADIWAHNHQKEKPDWAISAKENKRKPTMSANDSNVEYFVALITCEEQVFAAVINDPHGITNSDGLLEYAKRIAVAKFGYYICGKQYQIELLAAHWPPVIRATAIAPNEPDGVTYAGQ